PARRSEMAHRVDGVAVDPDFEVQVRPEASARAVAVADHLSLGDVRTGADGESLLVGVRGGEPVAVVDDDDVAVALLPAGDDDRPGGRRVDRGAGGDGDVDALVHPADAAEAAVPERADDRAVHRPDEPARRRLAMRVAAGARARGSRGLGRTDLRCYRRARRLERLRLIEHLARARAQAGE